MRLATLTVALIALAVPLGGCLSGDTPAAQTQDKPRVEALQNGQQPVAQADEALAALAEGLAADPANATVGAPVWAVGDAWTMSASAAEGGGSTNTLVVAATTPTGYVLRPSGEDLALYDALFDVSFVGTIRASDLAGAQDDAPVRFFDFPLRDGKTWTTTWDGLEVRITATLNRAIPTPLGPQPGFDLVATHEGEPYVVYDYVPALKWWSHVDFMGYGMRVDSFTPNWKGTVVHAETNPLLELTSGRIGPMIGAPHGSFRVSEEQSVLALVIQGQANEQLRSLVLVDPGHNVVPTPGETGVVQLVPHPVHESRVERLPPTPGQWEVFLAMAHDRDARYSFAFHEVAFVETPVG